MVSGWKDLVRIVVDRVCVYDNPDLQHKGDKISQKLKGWVCFSSFLKYDNTETRKILPGV